MEASHLVRKYRSLIVLLSHLLFILLAYSLAFILRFGISISPHYVQVFLKTLPFIVIIKIITFYVFKLFTSSIRFASVFDLWQIIKANTIAIFLIVLSIVFLHRNIGYPRSVLILDWVLCVGFCGSMRLIGRLWRDRAIFSFQSHSKKVIIVGAGEVGVLVLKECRSNPNINYQIVGFIDDSSHKENLSIQGIPVLGKSNEIPTLVEKFNIEEIIIAMPSASGNEIRKIIDLCQIPNIKIKTIPAIHEIISGELKLNLREIRPDDLLGRESVQINRSEIYQYLQGKKVLITGAAGSIGSELARQIQNFFPSQLLLIDNNESDLYFLEIELKDKYPNLFLKPIIGDIKDVSLLKYVFSKYRPEVIFHAAAFKHVPMLEYNLSAAVQNNIIGSRNLIYASEHYGVKSFVLISSDKAVNPTSVMGTTKRITEMILQAKSKNSRTKFIAVRFGNVLDSKGSVVPLFKKQIEQRSAVTVTHPEAKRYFMSVKEAVELVLQASAIGKGGEIFILDMGQQIKILDLAKNLITLSGFKPMKDIPIKFIGLRPGEKLSEETLHDIEKSKTTKYDKIFITQPNDFDPNELRKQVKKLESLSKIRDEKGILDMFRKVVPSYTPHNKE